MTTTSTLLLILLLPSARNLLLMAYRTYWNQFTVRILLVSQSSSGYGHSRDRRDSDEILENRFVGSFGHSSSRSRIRNQPDTARFQRTRDAFGSRNIRGRNRTQTGCAIQLPSA